MYQHENIDRHQKTSIVRAKTNAKIAYMNNPPNEGGEIQYLTPDEFKAKFNCEYTEGIVLKNQGKPCEENDFKGTKAKAAYERLMNPLENLVICKMTNDIGYGLFTTEDILVGTVICIYAGEYDPNTSEHVYSYGSINAARVGGYARFMQHQPISKEADESFSMQCLKNFRLLAIREEIPVEKAISLLNDTQYLAQKNKEYKNKVRANMSWDAYDFDQIHFINEDKSSQIAQSNVSIDTTKVNGIEVILMIAMRDIKKNESIGFSYGLMYWQHPSINNPPLLFTKTGQVLLPNKNYEYSQSQLIKNSLKSFKSNPFYAHLFQPQEKSIQKPQKDSWAQGSPRDNKVDANKSKLDKTLSYFKDESEQSLPTPEVALRRACAGLRPKNDAGLGKQKNVIQYLLTQVSDVNACSPTSGMTALHIAVTKNQVESTSLLLEAGASMRIQDKNNKTPQDYVLESSNNEIKKLFNSMTRLKL